MNSPRIVLDTNALLQILGATSPYHFLFQSFLREEYILCVSTEILLEYEEILGRLASRTAATLFLRVLAYSSNAIHKEPYFRFQMISADPDDNKFTDCAIVSQADMIVTDDGHFSEAAECLFPSVRAVGLDEFANLIRAAGRP